MKQRWFQPPKAEVSNPASDENPPDANQTKTEEILMPESIIITKEDPIPETPIQSPVEPAQPKAPFPIFSPNNLRMMNYIKREVRLATAMFSTERDRKSSADRDRFMNHTIRSLDTFPADTDKNDPVRIFLYYLETIIPNIFTVELETGEFRFMPVDGSDPDAPIAVSMSSIILDTLLVSLNSGSISSFDVINRLME